MIWLVEEWRRERKAEPGDQRSRVRYVARCRPLVGRPGREACPLPRIGVINIGRAVSFGGDFSWLGNYFDI